jgi:hypothetical protein
MDFVKLVSLRADRNMSLQYSTLTCFSSPDSMCGTDGTAGVGEEKKKVLTDPGQTVYILIFIQLKQHMI